MGPILGLIGSPRKGGNTDVLVTELLAAAGAEGATTEVVRLGELEIRECDGCHACWRGKPCTKDDDMPALIERIAGCDVIVFGTPVYWYGPTALMKACIDRFVYFNCPGHRPMIAGKRAAVVIPYEETAVETAAPVVRFFERCLSYLEMELVATLLAPGVTKRGEVRRRQDLMDRARELGARLARTVGSSR